MQTAQEVILQADTSDDQVALDYDARFLRRKVLTTRGGMQVLVDLPRTTSLNHGDALCTGTGVLIAIVAAPEPLLQVTGDDLTRIAWHIGNRHTPCQIEAGRLLIQRDHVMADLLSRIGAKATEVVEPFTPEGGAYGHGRTHGHDDTHAHGPDTGHTPEHRHDH
ncbi:MAG: urease accessory protein UreE [Roseobacter sp.]|jgi:urease accessory protein|nr:urease accessory protein UreE [Roseobacter sp.]